MNFRIVFSRKDTGYKLSKENKAGLSFKDYLLEEIDEGYLLILSITDWDDFGFKITFNASLFKVSNCILNGKVNLGKIKIGCKGYAGQEIIKHEFFEKFFKSKNEDRILDKLPENFYSIPEEVNYYDLLKGYFRNDENESLYLLSTKDISKNEEFLDAITDEKFFKKAFTRTSTFSMLETFEWLNSDKHKDIFDKNLENFKEILNDDLSKKSYEESMYIMLHGFLIASLENYLYGRFYYTVINSDELILKQALKEPAIKDITYTLNEIENWKNDVKERVLKSLIEKSFHNIGIVVPMYKNILNISFGKDLGWLFDAVQKRHDCAHRAGLDHNGKKVKIDKEYLVEIGEKVKVLVNLIERQRLNYE